MLRKLTVTKEEFPLLNPFKIAHGTRTVSEVILVEISEGEHIGQGESVPYARYNESCESVIEQIEQARPAIESGVSLEELQDLMPHGAARNAVDCALWNLKTKQENKELWEIASLPKPDIINTAYTLVINEPADMAKEASDKCQKFPILKLKLAGDGKDNERMLSVRTAAPNATIVIDANESWDPDIYSESIKACNEAGISMIEQPFKSNSDQELKTLERPITICADESCHTAGDLDSLVGKYDMINIKLDKTGGLTEALKLAKRAKELNFKVMVGCMVGTSLSVLPAYYLAQIADFVDIDCPVLLAKDRGLLHFDGAKVSVSTV